MLVETELELKMKKLDSNQIHAIILLVENSKFGGEDKPYFEKICGREMNEYLRNICSDFKISTAILEENADVQKTILPFIGEEEITAVLFSNTPLLTRETLMAYLEKFVYSNENFLFMPRGFIAKPNALKNSFKMQNSDLNYFARNEFFEVNSLKDLEQAQRVLQAKILDFHMQNGVKIMDRGQVFIDADAEIEKGAKICPFSQILGKSTIKSGAIISSSIIKNCIIGKNAIIENCNLSYCKVEDGARVKPFTFAEKKLVKGMK